VNGRVDVEDAKLNLDLDRLATHLRTKMEKDDLSIRSAAEKIGCSAATLARLLQGSKAENVPDSVNLMRAASWVGKRLGDFEVGKSKPSSTLGDVEVHLRALPGLSKADAEGLVAMVKAAYDAAAKLRAKKGSGR
jgi:transcriptional regulator with XRE-family HTH domain